MSSTGSYSMWAVMKAQPWDSLKVEGLPLRPMQVPLRAPPDGPSKFIALFDTREQAVAFDDGCEEHVIELTLGKKLNNKETE